MQDQGFDSLVYHYSSWYGLKKALAWLSRFKNYLLYRTGKIAKEDVKRGELSVREIQNAEVEVINDVQRLFFPRELNALMSEAQQRRSISRVSGKRLSDGSYVIPLRKLNPIADNNFSTASTDKYKKCWRQAQYLSNIFWRRWVDEYLLSLQERQKWIRPRRNVAVGDLVLIADEHSPRGQ